jgi:hypothetical protein
LDVGGEFVGGIGTAAVAIDAGELDGGGGVHGLDIDVAVGGLAGGLGVKGEGCGEEGGCGFAAEAPRRGEEHQNTILKFTNAE